jgi:hypothetical protein
MALGWLSTKMSPGRNGWRAAAQSVAVVMHDLHVIAARIGLIALILAGKDVHRVFAAVGGRNRPRSRAGPSDEPLVG